MGTSISQRSPSTPAWQAVRATYREPGFGAPQIAQSIWRAANSQPDVEWASMLGSPIVTSCLRIAAQSQSPAEALARVTREIALNRQSSLVAEIGKRAMLRCFASPEARTTAFASAVFGEAIAYLSSRDLAGHIGPRMALESVGQATEMRQSLRRHVESIARDAVPDGGLPDRRAWRRFVGTVSRRLRTGV